MKKYLILSVLMLLPMVASALQPAERLYDAKINGIYYRFSGNNAIVTCTEYFHRYYSDYSGTVVIPNSVTYNNCPYSVTAIDSYAFIDCGGLTSITIPNSITSIGEHAFRNCSGLKSITIPKSVTFIDDQAFFMTDIQTIVSLIEDPCGIVGKESDFGTFSLKTFNNATLYVPINTIEKYKATKGWKDFVHIEDGNSTTINTVNKNKLTKDNAYYTLDGRRISKPQNGLNLLMNDGKASKIMIR